MEIRSRPQPLRLYLRTYDIVVDAACAYDYAAFKMCYRKSILNFPNEIGFSSRYDLATLPVSVAMMMTVVKRKMEAALVMDEEASRRVMMKKGLLKLIDRGKK
ncbi:ethylene-responsive transcription factor ERF104-like [Zingiber officinale]|uniref:ethylene-responsive transcription factor ERF104-like n=1 Tax=Zingiber officinale TaxID=94328 RepID=UPI001C4BFC0C|nr:ethylene-responsive transcription factor ERF104-like [Zingiber officinale]